MSGGSGDRASKLLANLPSRSLLSANVVSSNLGGMRIYICDRDTSPPDITIEVPDKDLQSCTVEKLRALLKEKGLVLKGKKASRGRG